MGILSSTVSITLYKVDGELEQPILENLRKGLKKNVISEIDGQVSEKVAGWTLFDSPYKPDFTGSSHVVGNYFVFSLRIDKKVLPGKIIKKHTVIETEKRLNQVGRGYLTANEKKMIKDHVLNILNLRIPSTPNIYDLIWNYEASSLWFFTNLKGANEELETLFLKSFNLRLIRLFPYTSADITAGLSDKEKDVLLKLSPSVFWS
ncbi:MAG TPA: recombination-associated protein RdgC [Deltaproteobacteria bacterium]|nr:recombination-associated protein RdgC [Deltaproteobacteria bacterium]